MTHDAGPPKRTVAVAIAQANAKERIRDARGVRHAGFILLFVGLSALIRFRTWRFYGQIVEVHIHGGPTFRLSFVAIVGIVATALSPFVIGTGQLLLRRATRTAREDPITAPILNQLG